MKVGDYVRTKDGRIAKIETMVDDFLWFDNVIYYTYSDGIDTLNIEDIDKYIIKSSPNIIDLIEVGDYVNGWKVTQMTNSYVEICWGRDSDEFIKPENIKSVLTKEQFEQMEYKIN